jgi:carbonic anhydrase
MGEERVENGGKNRSNPRKIGRMPPDATRGQVMPTDIAVPDYIAHRFHAWRAVTYDSNRAWFRRLAEGGQHPREMIISCCDSRVHVTQIFGAESGEFFVHRNIANLVPDFAPDGDHHGTSAAVEYAVLGLKVAHLIVLGHSGCGGVRHCYSMCEGNAEDMADETSFVGRWMDILRPSYGQLSPDAPEDVRLRELEKESVRVSLDNLMTFPFVRQAVEDERLSLHGLWLDIGEGRLEAFSKEKGRFVEV